MVAVQIPFAVWALHHHEALRLVPCGQGGRGRKAREGPREDVTNRGRFEMHAAQMGGKCASSP